MDAFFPCLAIGIENIERGTLITVNYCNLHNLSIYCFVFVSTYLSKTFLWCVVLQWSGIKLNQYGN